MTGPRTRLHLKAAEWFEDSDPMLRAEHLRMAEDPGAAMAYLAAARSELTKYRYQQALALLAKGMPLAAEPADRVELSLALGEVQHDIGALDEARAAFAEALDAAEDDAARCRAWLGLAGVKRITEDLDGALADLDAAQAAADRMGLTVEAARAHFLRGNLLFPRGDTEGCLREHTLALELARRVGHARAELIAQHGGIICYKMRAEFDLARQHVEAGIILSRRLGARRFEAEDVMFRAELDHLEGNRDAALEGARAALAISRDVGMSFIGPAILGVLAFVTDDDTERRAASAEAEELLAPGSISHNHLFFRCNAIDACLRAGEHDEAERHADALTAYCPEDGLPLIAFFADRGRALARVGRGESSAGLAAEIGRLIAEGEGMQQALAITDLRRAREAMERSATA